MSDLQNSHWTHEKSENWKGQGVSGKSWKLSGKIVNNFGCLCEEQGYHCTAVVFKQLADEMPASCQ